MKITNKFDINNQKIFEGDKVISQWGISFIEGE